MRIYPAIDILGGKCVRLTQGRYEDSSVYGENPAEIAVQWEQKGASFLHLVDLDGARAGKPINLAVLRAVREAVSLPMQVGGGIRSETDVKTLLDLGVSRVILGTGAAESAAFVRQMAERYGERIAVGVDAKDGMVAVNGWEKTSRHRAIPFAQEMEKCGVKTIVYTDIATDGMLTGCNVAAMQEMTAAVSLDVIASGGIGALADVEALLPVGVAGVIIGRALYTGKVALEDALKFEREGCCEK